MKQLGYLAWGMATFALVYGAGLVAGSGGDQLLANFLSFSGGLSIGILSVIGR